MIDTGKLVVISGPSGAGKSTVISKVMKSDPNFVFSVSATTRKPRKGERDGVDYLFLGESDFVKMMAAGELLEHAK